MNLEFIENLYKISHQQYQDIQQTALYLTIATSLYYVLFGGVMSISNMIGEILKRPLGTFFLKAVQQSRAKLTLISGLIFVSALIKTVYHEHITSFNPFDPQKYTQKTSALRLIISGLLVGFGSQYTIKDSRNSFALDGIPCFNLKSFLGNLVAFIVASFVHTYQIHLYLPETPRIFDISLPKNIDYNAYLLVFLLIPFICFIFSSKKSFKVLTVHLTLFGIGSVFAAGLMMGGFTERKTVYTFLNINKHWNPAMAIMFLYGIMANALVYLVMRYLIKKPVFASFTVQNENNLKANLLVGATIFGIGWGLGGLKPDSVLVLMPLESIKIVFYWGLSCLIGMKTAHKLFESMPEQMDTKANSDENLSS